MITRLAKRLVVARANIGLSRKQVAERLGVSESLIGLYESANRQPSLENLMKLATTYKVTTDYLLGCEQSTTESISLYGLNEMQIQSLTQAGLAVESERKLYYDQNIHY